MGTAEKGRQASFEGLGFWINDVVQQFNPVTFRDSDERKMGMGRGVRA